MPVYQVLKTAYHKVSRFFMPAVGASLFAMVVNDDAASLIPRSALGFIASRLAPT